MGVGWGYDGDSGLSKKRWDLFYRWLTRPDKCSKPSKGEEGKGGSTSHWVQQQGSAMNRMEMDTRTLTKAASGPACFAMGGPVLCIWLWGRQSARLGMARMR